MEFVQELLRPFVNELGEVREELGAERARRESAERTLHERMAEAERTMRKGMVEAEATLREGMAEERRRREEAERERDELRREMYALTRQREGPGAKLGAQEGAQRRSWWRRIIGS
jgi:hypothetical protein